MLKNGELYDDSLDVADREKRKAEKLDSARKIVEHRINKLTEQKHHINTDQDTSVSISPVPQVRASTITLIYNADKPSSQKNRGVHAKWWIMIDWQKTKCRSNNITG